MLSCTGHSRASQKSKSICIKLIFLLANETGKLQTGWLWTAAPFGACQREPNVAAAWLGLRAFAFVCIVGGVCLSFICVGARLKYFNNWIDLLNLGTTCSTAYKLFSAAHISVYGCICFNLRSMKRNQ